MDADRNLEKIKTQILIKAMLEHIPGHLDEKFRKRQCIIAKIEELQRLFTELDGPRAASVSR